MAAERAERGRPVRYSGQSIGPGDSRPVLVAQSRPTDITPFPPLLGLNPPQPGPDIVGWDAGTRLSDVVRGSGLRVRVVRAAVPISRASSARPARTYAFPTISCQPCQVNSRSLPLGAAQMTPRSQPARTALSPHSCVAHAPKTAMTTAPAAKHAHRAQPRANSP